MYLGGMSLDSKQIQSQGYAPFFRRSCAVPGAQPERGGRWQLGDGLKKVDCLLESLRTYRSLPYVTEMTSGLNVTLTH